MLIDVPSATLRKMVKLSERKEALLSQIQELDRQMAALQENEIERQPRKSSGRIFATTGAMKEGQRATRGALKAKILGALRAAGRRGLTIRELSARLNVKPANLYVWFNGTGRKAKGIKKIGPAKYRLSV
jgi:hypothetical protein